MYKCLQCELQFSTQTELKHHMQTYCLAKQSTDSRKRADGPEETDSTKRPERRQMNTIIRCPYCNAMYLEQGVLDAHISCCRSNPRRNTGGM